MSDVAAIAQDLADHAQEICQRYLSNGKQVGRYWQVGDLANNPGRSLVVRLEQPGRGPWQDYATQERGDLLDLIRHAGRYPDLASAIEAARQFLEGSRSVTPPKAKGGVTYDPISLTFLDIYPAPIGEPTLDGAFDESGDPLTRTAPDGAWVVAVDATDWTLQLSPAG